MSEAKKDESDLSALLAAGKNIWSCAATLKKDEGSTANIALVTGYRIMEGNEDEVTGNFLKKAKEDYPEHLILMYSVVMVEAEDS